MRLEIGIWRGDGGLGDIHHPAVKLDAVAIGVAKIKSVTAATDGKALFAPCRRSLRPERPLGVLRTARREEDAGRKAPGDWIVGKWGKMSLRYVLITCNSLEAG